MLRAHELNSAAALRSRTRREQQQPQGAEKEEGGSDSGSASDSDGDSEDESGHGDLEDVCVLGVSGWGEEGRSWSSESSTCSPERERGDAEATLSQEMERTLRSQPVTSILRDPGERALPLRQSFDAHSPIPMMVGRRKSVRFEGSEGSGHTPAPRASSLPSMRPFVEESSFSIPLHLSRHRLSLTPGMTLPGGSSSTELDPSPPRQGPSSSLTLSLHSHFSKSSAEKEEKAASSSSAGPSVIVGLFPEEEEEGDEEVWGPAPSAPPDPERYPQPSAAAGVESRDEWDMTSWMSPKQGSSNFPGAPPLFPNSPNCSIASRLSSSGGPCFVSGDSGGDRGGPLPSGGTPQMAWFSPTVEEFLHTIKSQCPDNCGTWGFLFPEPLAVATGSGEDESPPSLPSLLEAWHNAICEAHGASTEFVEEYQEMVSQLDRVWAMESTKIRTTGGQETVQSYRWIQPRADTLKSTLDSVFHLSLKQQSSLFQVDLAEARVEHFLHQLLVHSPLGLRYVNEQHILEEKRRQLASEYPEEALLMVGIGERVHVQPASGSNGHETPESSLQPILQCLVTMEHALLDVTRADQNISDDLLQHHLGTLMEGCQAGSCTDSEGRRLSAVCSFALRLNEMFIRFLEVCISSGEPIFLRHLVCLLCGRLCNGLPVRHLISMLSFPEAQLWSPQTMDSFLESCCLIMSSAFEFPSSLSSSPLTGGIGSHSAEATSPKSDKELSCDRSFLLLSLSPENLCAIWDQLPFGSVIHCAIRAVQSQSPYGFPYVRRLVLDCMDHLSRNFSDSNFHREQLHEFSFRATQSVISFLNSFAAGVSSLLPSMPLVYRRAVQTQLDETIFSLVESMLSLPPACVTLVLPLLYTAPVQFVDKVCADRIFMRLFFGCEVDAPLLSSVDRLDIGIWETERFAMRPGARTSFHLRMLNLGDRLIFVLKFLTSLFSFERLPYIIGVEVFHLGVFLVSKGSYLVREARNVIIEAIPLERALVCTFSCCSKYFYHQW